MRFPPLPAELPDEAELAAASARIEDAYTKLALRTAQIRSELPNVFSEEEVRKLDKFLGRIESAIAERFRATSLLFLHLL